MTQQDIEAAKKILADNGITIQPTAWEAKVKKYGLEEARRLQRQARAKVNPKNIKGRPKRLVGGDAEG